MEWHILRKDIPNCYNECVVVRINRKGKSFGMCVLQRVCGELFWVTRSGSKLKALANDHWYYVDDIISNVMDNFLEYIDMEYQLNTYDG